MKISELLKMDGDAAIELLIEKAHEWELCAANERQWISVDEALPEEDTDVAFIVNTKGRGSYEYMDGYIMGGRFHYMGKQPTFSVPGIGFIASYWMNLPPSPDQES